MPDATHTAENAARTGSRLVCTYCGTRGHLNTPCPDLQAAEEDAGVQRFEVEFQRPYYGDAPSPWEPLFGVIGGIRSGFATLDEARKMVNENLPAIAKADAFFKPLAYRVVSVTRRVIPPASSDPSDPA